MNAYEILKKFQNDIEQLTGVKPNINVSFHSHGDFDDRKCQIIRNLFTEYAQGELVPADLLLGKEDTFMLYRSRTEDMGIDVSVFGPHRKEVKEHA